MASDEETAPNEQTIAVNTDHIIEWYDNKFVLEGSRIPKHIYLDNLLRDHLQLKKIPALSTETRAWQLGSKQTFSEWRKGAINAVRKTSVMLALLQVTGIDFSMAKSLSIETIDFTKLVKLGKLLPQPLSNRPDENDVQQFRLRLSSISFLRAWEEVTSTWITCDSSDGVSIGQVHYALREAYLQIERCCVGSIHFESASETLLQYETNCDAVVILWDEKQSLRIFQPTKLGQNLHATIVNAEVGQVLCKNGDKVRAIVSFVENQVSHEFVLSEFWKDRYRNPDMSMSDRLSKKFAIDLMQARQRLIALVIGQRNRRKIASLTEVGIYGVET